MTDGPSGDAWYLPADRYWVPASDVTQYPVRQGDLFGPVSVDGEEWFATQIVHPTCELEKSSVTEIQVVRVRPVADLDDEKQRTRIIVGWQERNLRVTPAFAHTFFLVPSEPAPFDQPMFSNLREVSCRPRGDFDAGNRIAALTHDARVTLIRRKLYFRYRLMLPFEEVRRLEANRISNDPAFKGPKPDWAM